MVRTLERRGRPVGDDEGNGGVLQQLEIVVGVAYCQNTGRVDPAGRAEPESPSHLLTPSDTKLRCTPP